MAALSPRRTLSPLPAPTTVPTLAAEGAGKLTDTAADDSFDSLEERWLEPMFITVKLTADLRRARRIQRCEYRGSLAPRSLTVNDLGTYTYVPEALQAINALHEGNYTDTFTVRTADVHGAVGTAILTVNVQGANDTPSIVGEVKTSAQIVVVTSAHVLAAGVNVSSLGVEHGDVRRPDGRLVIQQRCRSRQFP